MKVFRIVKAACGCNYNAVALCCVKSLLGFCQSYKAVALCSKLYWFAITVVFSSNGELGSTLKRLLYAKFQNIKVTSRTTLLLVVVALLLSPLVSTVAADHAVREHVPILWPNARPFFEGMTYGTWCSPRNGTVDVVRTFDLCRRVGADVRSTYCWTSQSPNWAAVNPLPGNRAQPIANANPRIVRGRAYACSDAINLNNVIANRNGDGTLTVSWRTGINADATIDVSRPEAGFTAHLEDSRQIRTHLLTTSERLSPGSYSVQVTSHSSVTGRSETTTSTYTVEGGGGAISIDVTAPLDGASIQYNAVDTLRIVSRPSGTSAVFTLENYIDGVLQGAASCTRGDVCTYRATLPLPRVESYNVSVIATDGVLRAMDSVSVTITKRIPVITISGPASAVYGTATMVSCSARDPATGDIPTRLVSLTIDGRAAGNPDAERLGGGIYTYVCSTSETPELAAASASQVLTINQAAPSVSLMLNGMSRDVAVASGASVTMSGMLIMSGADTGVLRLIIDGAEIMNGISAFTRNQAFVGLGPHSVTASYDGSQNYTAAFLTRTVTVNSPPAAPVVTFLPPTPMDGSSIESPLRISIESNEDLASATATAVDAMGRSRPAILTRVDARHYQGSIVLPTGTHTFTASARDVNDGLTGTTETRSITIATGAPVITFIAPTPANDISIEGSFTVAIQSNEDLSSATLRVIDAGGRSTSTPMTRVDARNYQLLQTLTPGIYTYSVSGVDLMGVFGTSETRRITINAPGTPVLTFTTPPTPANAASVRGAFTAAISSSIDLSSATIIVTDAGAREVLRRAMSRTDARNYQTLIMLSPGSYSYSVTGVSVMGVSGSSSSRQITIIPGAPTLTFIPPTPANNSAIQISFTVSISSDLDLASANVVTRNEAGVEATTPLSWVDARHFQTTLTLTPGDYSYYVSGIDLMGATSITETRLVTVSKVQLEHTFGEYAFGGLVAWERIINFPGLPWPADPRALFVGTRAAPGVRGGTVQRSFNGIDWETVYVPNYVPTLEGVYSMYADPAGWIYAGFGGWTGADEARIIMSRTGGVWDSGMGGAMSQYRITAIATPWDYVHYASEGSGSSRLFWESPGGGGFFWRGGGPAVKILRTDTETFYISSTGDFYHTVPGSMPHDDIVWFSSARGTINDAEKFNGVIYLGGIFSGVPAVYSTTDGLTFTLVREFDASSTSIKGFFVAPDNKLYFAVNTPNGSRVWSINAARVVTNEFRVMNADQVDYVAEFNNYLYVAGVNDGTLSLYRTINTIR